MSIVLEPEWLERRTRVFLPPIRQTQWGYFLANFYAKNKELRGGENFFVKLHNGIGDQVSILGLLSACREKTNALNIILVATERSRELLSFYSNVFDRVVFFKEFPPFEPAPAGSTFDVLHMPSKAHIFDGGLNAWFTRLCVPYVDQYRIGLGLPPGSKYVFPKVPNENDPEVKAVKELTTDAVILFPHSNTWPGPGIKFWSELALSLSGAGLRVFTNVKNSVNNNGFQRTSSETIHGEIPGTQPLNCSLAALLGASTVWRGWVSGVSGPAFLLAGSACPGIVTHLNRRIPFEDGSNVKLVDVDSVSKSFPSIDNLYDVEVNEQESRSAISEIHARLA